ncbi:MAG: hypothetical protein MI725_07610, partial [Pirellulales bacterium]|nr:hypothetical protein [Pirellulales bacterium]
CCGEAMQTVRVFTEEWRQVYLRQSRGARRRDPPRQNASGGLKYKLSDVHGVDTTHPSFLY